MLSNIKKPNVVVLDRLENFYCLILSSSDEKNEKSFIKVKYFLFLTKKKQKIERFLESPLSPFTKFQTEHYKLWESFVQSFSLKVWKFYCVFNLFSFIVSSTPFFSIPNSSSENHCLFASFSSFHLV